MKKDIEWLKEKVEEMYTHYSISNNFDFVSKREAITEISNLIDQLEEPEVLSQKWIDRNRFEVNGWIEAVHVEDLQYLLVPKQDKPVIPQFVADYYNDYKSHELTFAEWFECPGFGKGGKGEIKTFEWLLDNSNEVNIERQFILADIIAHGLDGYEVEKEKRYYVLDHLGKTMLFKIDGFVERSFGYEVTKLPSSPDTSYLLTETEIKDFDERYWAFAEEVTE